MSLSKRESARKLARFHFEVEPALKNVYLLAPVREDDPREPIKLLEVVEGAVEVGIQPVSFASDPAHGIHFPSTIVELSPREFALLNPDNIIFRDRVWSVESELREH